LYKICEGGLGGRPTKLCFAPRGALQVSRESAGKCFLDMLGVFAEFETNIRKERQTEGIAKAKAEGRYTGRKKTIDDAEIRRLKREGVGATEIARRLNINGASVYRV
jgi:DNA invertase Pin-like site-specific DNA recombinase